MYVHCEAVHLLQLQNEHVLHAGNLLPNHLEPDLDQQLASLAGCSLLQFLFFLLQDLQLKSQNFRFKYTGYSSSEELCHFNRHMQSMAQEMPRSLTAVLLRLTCSINSKSRH